MGENPSYLIPESSSEISEGSDNRMQNFYGCATYHFACTVDVMVFSTFMQIALNDIYRINPLMLRKDSINGFTIQNRVISETVLLHVVSANNIIGNNFSPGMKCGKGKQPNKRSTVFPFVSDNFIS